MRKNERLIDIKPDPENGILNLLTLMKMRRANTMLYSPMFSVHFRHKQFHSLATVLMMLECLSDPVDIQFPDLTKFH